MGHLKDLNAFVKEWEHEQYAEFGLSKKEIAVVSKWLKFLTPEEVLEGMGMDSALWSFEMRRPRQGYTSFWEPFCGPSLDDYIEDGYLLHGTFTSFVRDTLPPMAPERLEEMIVNGWPIYRVRAYDTSLPNIMHEVAHAFFSNHDLDFDMKYEELLRDAIAFVLEYAKK